MAPFLSNAQRKYMFAKHPKIAKKWSAEYPNQGKLPEHVRSKKKYKLRVNNKMKGSLGAMNPKTNVIEINRKAHGKDKAELASTIAHELMHVKQPNATEKEVYKATAKTKISPEERRKLLARLRNARIIKKSNSLKKKYKVEGDNPGDIYQKANENPIRRTAIMGLV